MTLSPTASSASTFTVVGRSKVRVFPSAVLIEMDFSVNAVISPAAFSSAESLEEELLWLEVELLEEVETLEEEELDFEEDELPEPPEEQAASEAAIAKTSTIVKAFFIIISPFMCGSCDVAARRGKASLLRGDMDTFSATHITEKTPVTRLFPARKNCAIGSVR